MLCARNIVPPLEASANLPLVYLSMTLCLLDQLSIPPWLMCWFAFVFIALFSLLIWAKCTEPSNWFLQIEISIDLFGERITMSHWRVTAWQGPPLECQLPHLLQTYQWSGDISPCYLVSKLLTSDYLTKWLLVSDITKTFDVLGWFSPSIIKAKILLQCCWEQKLNWDDPVPSAMYDAWYNWRSCLRRNVFHVATLTHLKSSLLNFTCFCDASVYA